MSVTAMAATKRLPGSQLRFTTFRDGIAAAVKRLEYRQFSVQWYGESVKRGFVMSTISIEDAQAKLAELIRNMAPGEELIITAGNQPVARLTNTNGTPFSTSRQPLKLS